MTTREVSGDIEKMLSILGQQPTPELAELAGELVGKELGTERQRMAIIDRARKSEPSVREAFLRGAEKGNSKKMDALKKDI